MMALVLAQEEVRQERALQAAALAGRPAEAFVPSLLPPSLLPFVPVLFTGGGAAAGGDCDSATDDDGDDDDDDDDDDDNYNNENDDDDDDGDDSNYDHDDDNDNDAYAYMLKVAVAGMHMACFLPEWRQELGMRGLGHYITKAPVCQKVPDAGSGFGWHMACFFARVETRGMRGLGPLYYQSTCVPKGALYEYAGSGFGWHMACFLPEWRQEGCVGWVTILL